MPLGRGLATATKIGIARGLGRAVRAARSIAGRRGPEVECARNGVRFLLDLREGVQLALYLGVYERATTRRLAQFVEPGMTVVDVGANVGAHTLPLARAVGAAGHVVAVEPTTAALDRLRRNRDLNPDLAPRIVTVHAALGAPHGAAKPAYYSAWPLEDGGLLHPVHRGAERPAGDAQFWTLDELVRSLALDRVGLIKIDVDGSEMDVLEGATGVIQRDRPVVFFEFCPYLLTEIGRTARDLVSYFWSREYELFHERSLRPTGPDIDRILASVPPSGSRNLIARPARRSDTAPRPQGLD
jgi:FkbM family methyltransferase